jgi:hypothetical protein
MSILLASSNLITIVLSLGTDIGGSLARPLFMDRSVQTTDPMSAFVGHCDPWGCALNVHHQFLIHRALIGH